MHIAGYEDQRKGSLDWFVRTRCKRGMEVSYLNTYVYNF